MKKIRIVITDEAGTVLDSEEIELSGVAASTAYLLRAEVISVVGDMNFARMSNLLGEE